MRRNHLGFNLVELIVVVAIAAVLLALALPSVGAQLERTRVVTAHNQLAAAFAHARLLALTQRTQAVVCPSMDGESCRNDGVWESGWITFVDGDGDGVRDAIDTLLKADAPPSDALRIRSSRYRSRAMFQSNGMARGANFTLRFCGANPEVLGALVLNNGGRVRAAAREELRALPSC